jgi:peptidoglycan-associated lipoprotein
MSMNSACRLALKLAGVAVTAVLFTACSERHLQRLGSGPGAYGAWDGDGTISRGGDRWGNGLDGPVTPGSPREFAVKAGDTVHFSTDSSELGSEAQSILQSQARWLQQYNQYALVIEGHADERGTREYNIALGARRAAVVKQYLASQGIDPGRMTVTSYGKERPVAVCDDISCWSQNRRAVTVLDRRGAPVASYR